MSDLISYGFLTPPAVLILLSLAGALLALRWRGFGVALVILSSAALYLLATPLVASTVRWHIDLTAMAERSLIVSVSSASLQKGRPGDPLDSTK